MNKILLQNKGYAQVTNRNNSVDINYTLLKQSIQKNNLSVINALARFIILYNTFISTKFPDNKTDWIVITPNQKEDSSQIVIDIENTLTELEKRLTMLEEYKGFKTPSKSRLIVNGDWNTKWGSYNYAVNMTNGSNIVELPITNLQFPQLKSRGNTSVTMYGGGAHGLSSSNTVQIIF